MSNISRRYIQEKPDMFLRDIPDCPMTLDLNPDPINRLSCKNSNSLYRKEVGSGLFRRAL